MKKKKQIDSIKDIFDNIDELEGINILNSNSSFEDSDIYIEPSSLTMIINQLKNHPNIDEYKVSIILDHLEELIYSFRGK